MQIYVSALISEVAKVYIFTESVEFILLYGSEVCPLAAAQEAPLHKYALNDHQCYVGGPCIEYRSVWSSILLPEVTRLDYRHITECLVIILCMSAMYLSVIYCDKEHYGLDTLAVMHQ